MGGRKAALRGCLRSNALTLATMAGVLIGVVAGIIIKVNENPEDR